MDLSPGYREIAPPVALRERVACLWVRVAPPWETEPVHVLPDTCSDVIWSAARPTFVAGPDTGPQPARVAPGEVLVGVRFLPGAGGAALGVPLVELRDQRVDAAALGRRWERLTPELSPGAALVALAHAATGPPPDAAVREAARRLAVCPQTPVRRLADELGLSERQLRRRCDAAAGYGPKVLARVLRFRGALRAIEGTADDLAAVALEHGYADQAHLTRECARLAGRTPAALRRAAI